MLLGKQGREGGKIGLVNHRRRMHEESALKKTFECNECKQIFKKASERKNHQKICGGAEASAKDRRKCVCGVEYSKSYFRVHRQRCEIWKAQQQPIAGAPVEQAPPAAPTAPCPGCGKTMRKDNLARHQRTACPGSVAGP